MASAGARAYRGSGIAPAGGSGAKPPEAESSVAFEALAEEPNLTLVKTINILPAL